MGKRSPKAPDPQKTADAQAGMNRETAITQFGLNAANQVNPWGDITYAQIGEWEDGTPRFQQTTSLSPEQRAIFEANQQAQDNLANIANEQSAFLRDYFATPFSSNPTIRTDAGQSGQIGGFDARFNRDIGGAFTDQLGPGWSSGVDLATSYAGADDFSADRMRVEDALWERTAGDRTAAENALTARLANQGIRPGSAAYNAEMERLARQNTDARLATLLAGGQEQSRLVGLARDAAGFGNEAALQQAGFGNQAALAQGAFGNEAALARAGFGSAQQQAQNAAALQQAGFGNQAAMANAQFANQAAGQQFAMDLARRNQPLNEVTALMSGSQVSNPASMSGPTPQTQVAGVDYAGLVNQNYQQQLAQQQGAWGGIGGLFGSVLGAAGQAGGFGALFSDERLKTDVRRVGTTDGGIPVYTYRYLGEGPVHMGVMAQDVAEATPEAVHRHESGFLTVRYDKVA